MSSSRRTHVAGLWILTSQNIRSVHATRSKWIGHNAVDQFGEFKLWHCVPINWAASFNHFWLRWSAVLRLHKDVLWICCRCWNSKWLASRNYGVRWHLKLEICMRLEKWYLPERQKTLRNWQMLPWLLIPVCLLFQVRFLCWECLHWFFWQRQGTLESIFEHAC